MRDKKNNANMPAGNSLSRLIKFQVSLLTFLISIYLVPLCNASTIVGYVYNAKALEYSYQELHTINDDLHSVSYRNPDETQFAYKSIEYHRENSKPNIAFESQHCQERYAIDAVDQTQLDISYSNACENKQAQALVRLDEPFVVDAGFDHYIRDNLANIQQKNIVFDYPAPSRTSNIALKASAISCEKVISKLGKLLQIVSSEHNNRASWQQCVAVRAKSWLIAQFLPPIYLAYDQDNTLALYSGRSNMSDAEGNYQDIVIFYYYPPS